MYVYTFVIVYVLLKVCKKFENNIKCRKFNILCCISNTLTNIVLLLNIKTYKTNLTVTSMHLQIIINCECIR